MSIIAVVVLALLVLGFVLMVMGKNGLLWDVAILVALIFLIVGGLAPRL